MGIFGFGKGKTLYYPGCLTKGVLKEQFENYKEIFNRLGIDFVLLGDDEVCCGLPILNGGYRKDARKLALKNYELFKSKGIKRILTNCPSCYHTFKEIYPKLIPAWDIEVEHATVSIYKKLLKKRSFLGGRESVVGGRDEDREVVMYHDPCHLGRYSGIYEEPRLVIEMLGGRILESKYNRENAFCCGAGGGVRANFPEVAKAMARKKVSYVPENIGKIISPCGLCYANLLSGTQKIKGEEEGGRRKVESVEFSDFVVRRLRGRR
ncbi:MAG: (Fe-S)-binding protein [Nanoarchaeota archaeon]|nr:(Fe-S)-binding protein [Nanoarchaeota archaeon]